MNKDFQRFHDYPLQLISFLSSLAVQAMACLAEFGLRRPTARCSLLLPGRRHLRERSRKGSVASNY